MLLPAGSKFPPIEKAWQEKPHTFTEAVAHKGNVGVLAGNGYIGLDQDDPKAFHELGLPATTTWETRPGRLGMWFSANGDVREALESIGKKPDLAQIKLYKDGKPCGEIKLSRSYQVIPPSWKEIDGQRVDYRILAEVPPARVGLKWLVQELQKAGISFSSRLEQNASKLECMAREARQSRTDPNSHRARRYAEAALAGEVEKVREATVGNRNNQLNESAFALGQFVAAGLLSQDEVVSALLKVAQDDEPGKIMPTILSGLSGGMRSPRAVPENVPHALKLPENIDDLPDGMVGVDPHTYAVKKVQISKNKHGELKPELMWISDCALFIHTETIARDTTEFIFCGTGAIDKREVRFTLPASVAADARGFRAACVNAFGAKNRVGALSFETVQLLTCDPRIVERVEVPAWRGNIPLVPGVGLAENVEFKLSAKIPAEVREGDLQVAKEYLKKMLMIHRYAPILATAILGSPAVARWRKNDRFGVGLWGSTGTLKTTTALLFTSIYGAGYLDSPKLKAGRGGSTTVGAMEVFAAAGFLPQIYDDVKTVDSRDAQNYVAVIHAVLEGEEKARGKKDGGLRESREFSCIPVVTGEVRPSEASTTARVLNIPWSRPDTAMLSELQQNAAILPTIGYHWLRFLAETSSVLGKDFDSFRTAKMGEFAAKGYTNPGRLATIYTVLVATWQLLEESPFGDIFTEYRGTFKSALCEVVAEQGAAVSEETEISRFLCGLEELIVSNPGLIMSVDGIKTITGPIIGKWTTDGLFLMPAETLSELSKIKVFSQQPTIESITRGLMERGILRPDPEGGRLKYRLRINGRRVRGWYLVGVGDNLGGLSQPGGGGKNDSSRHNVPEVPGVHGVYERSFKEKILGEKLNEKNGHKSLLENNGDYVDNGDIKDIDRIDRYTDIDFQNNLSKESVPRTVPKGVPGGDDEEKIGIGPHPRRDEPTHTYRPARDRDTATSKQPGQETGQETKAEVTGRAGDKKEGGIGATGKQNGGNQRICAVCGEDLTGRGYIERGGRIYCAKPGCGYPPRKSNEDD